MHRKRPLLVAAFFVYCVVIHFHHDSNSRFVAKPEKFLAPKSTHYKKGAPLEYVLSVVAQTSPERSTLL
jgi:hypothetical protein